MNDYTIDEIKARLRSLICTDLDANIRESDITDEISLFDDGLGLDSISIINFIVLIENKFEINFEETEITAKFFSNLNNLSAFIDSKQKSKVKADLKN